MLLFQVLARDFWTHRTLNVNMRLVFSVIEVGQSPPDGKGDILLIFLKLTSSLLEHHIVQRLVVHSLNRSDGNDTLEEIVGR